jgi:hypothetical protein
MDGLRKRDDKSSYVPSPSLSQQSSKISLLDTRSLNSVNLSLEEAGDSASVLGEGLDAEKKVYG